MFNHDDGLDKRNSSGKTPPDLSPQGPFRMPAPGSKRRLWGELRVVSAEEFTGSQDKLQALNDSLAQAWSRSNSVCWILARVRCEILKLSPAQYSEAHCYLKALTLTALETSHPSNRVRFNPQTIHLLLKGWEKLAAQYEDSNAQVTAMLREARRELLLAITRKYGRSVYGVLARWRYEVGPREFDSCSGFSHKAMWQRWNKGLIFDFATLLKIGRSLKFINSGETPPHLWRNERVKELEAAWMSDSKKLGRPKPVFELYKIVEASGLRVDRRILCRNLDIKLGSVVVAALYRFEVVPWRKIDPLFRYLQAQGFMTSPQYRRSKTKWIESYNSRPESFEGRLRAIRDERGLTNAQLADALGLKRSGLTKPSVPVFKAIAYGESNKHAPHGVLAHLVGRTDKEVDQLLEHKRQEILAQWRRQGSKLDSPIAVERELWCLDYSDLSCAKEELQSLEWGGKSPLSSASVMAEIREKGEARAKGALKQLLSRRDLSTVRSAISNLVPHGELAPQARRLETSVPVLKNIMSGVEVPTYPKLVGFLAAVGRKPSLALEVDWRDQFARHLISENRNDLERVLDAYVAERSDSRSSLLKEIQVPSWKGARLLNWISEAALVESQALATLLDSLGLDSSDPRRLFIEQVAETGSVAAGLFKWLRMIERVEIYSEIRANLSKALRVHPRSSIQGGSLQKLRTQMAQFEQPSAESSEGSAVCEVLRLLPGVTLAEVENALNTKVAPQSSTETSLVQRCFQNGLNRNDLVFALCNVVPSDRRPLRLLEWAINLGISSPAVPLGVLAYLGSQSTEVAESEIVKVRSELARRIRGFNLPCPDALIEMRLWGVRSSDLDLTPKEFAQEIWGGSEESSAAPPVDEVRVGAQPIDGRDSRWKQHAAHQSIAMRARELGLKKVSIALRDLSYRRMAVVPWQLVEVAARGTEGKDRAFSKQAGFPSAAATQFMERKVIPTPRQLMRIVDFAKLPLTEEMKAGWGEAYADFLYKRGTAPLGRALLCQIVSREFDRTGEQGEVKGKTLVDAIVSAFLRDAGLNARTYRQALKEACTTGVIANEHMSALVSALGHAPDTVEASLLNFLSGVNDVPAAVLSRSEKTGSSDAVVRGFLEVGALYDKGNRPRQDETATTVQERIVQNMQRLHEPHGSVSPSLAAARRSLLGMTPDEIISARARVQAKLSQSGAAALGKSGASAQPEMWVKTAALLRSTIDDRLESLVERLQSGKPVTVADTFELFPEWRGSIGEMQSFLSQETPWFVAIAAFFYDPIQALEELCDQLRQGRNAKGTGAEVFERQVTWMRDRRGLGKLDSKSMRLNFRDPLPHISK